VEARETDRVVELLVKIKQEQDGSLAFRKSCAHGVCGSDAMRINHKESLACKVLVKDVLEPEQNMIILEPLLNLTVEKDLMVDQEEFFKRYLSIKPFLINEEKKPKKEMIQTPEQRVKIDDGTKCILCESCYSACPVLQKTNPLFLGPAQIVQAQRFNDDSRDRGFEERMKILDTANGIWPCENHFECTRVCPRGIKVTKIINLQKQQIRKFKQEKK
jgi:succinate dehydrogenase / fumarate reductase iron-sulfur subunit